MNARLVYLLLTVFSVPVFAAAPCDSSDPSTALACFDRLAQCSAIEQDGLRLACYRSGGKASTLDSAGKPADGVQVAAKASIEEAYPVAGGVAREEEREAPVISAKVTKAERNAHKRFYIWLDNGHVWREKERSRFRYEEGTEITVSKGALGANYLKVNGKTGLVLVERVK